MCKPKSEGGLGFKDLYAFNLALLTKQGWRFIHNPSSFAARLFKAWYFPTTDFLQAPMKNNASHIWRSIAESRLIIRKGFRWRVGDGLKVRIWGDSWIPRESFFKVLSPNPQGWSHALTVRSLIVDLERLVWDEGLIHNILWKEEIELIMSIPLSLFQPLDSLI